MRQTSSVDYEISLASNPDKRHIVHFDTLKMFEGNKSNKSEDTSSSLSDNKADSSDMSDAPPLRSDDHLADMADLFLPHPSQLTATDWNSTDSDGSESVSSPDDVNVSDRHQRRHGLRPRHMLRPPKRYSN